MTVLEDQQRIEVVMDRLLSRCVETPEGCWRFTGGQSGGYGVIGLGGGIARRCHRVTYRYFRGEIPHHLVLDHLCMNKMCCNPWHLEPVTRQVNTLRAYRTGLCRPGLHEMTPENCYWTQGGRYRACRACMAAYNRAKASGIAAPRDRTHCPAGHEYTDDNTYKYRSPAGYLERRCRECSRARKRVARKDVSQ